MPFLNPLSLNLLPYGIRFTALVPCLHRISGPIPPFKNRRRIGAKWLGGFLGGGKQAYDSLSHVIQRYHARPLRDLSVLDFGCGCGRVAQFFIPEVAEFCATEVDPLAVKYLRTSFPQIRVDLNGPMPPLPYKEASFDVFYSWSVWTHLPYQAQEAWIQETAKVLKPGGLALITTHGLTLFRNLRNNLKSKNQWQDSTERGLLNSGILYKDYSFLHDKRYKRLLSGIEGQYGTAFHSPNYIRENWSKYLEILEIQEGAMHNKHDLVVARKKS